MTTAPRNLLALRDLYLSKLPLSGVAVGIVADSAHRGGYHCGRDRVDLDDYSVDESSRDRNGLTDYASAIDEGWWSLRVDGKEHNLHTHSIWVVAQCKAGTADSRDIREVIYSPDGQVVRRWDRLGIRTSGDNSHLSHTHRSYFRDATRDGRDLTALDRRYFTEIGLLGGDEMELSDEITKGSSVGGPYRLDALFVQGLIARRLLDGSGDVTGPGTAPYGLIRRVDEVHSLVDGLYGKADEIIALLTEIRDRPSGAPTLADLTEAVRVVLREGVNSKTS